MRRSLSKSSRMQSRKPLIVIGIFVAILVLIFFVKTINFYPFLFHLIFDKGVNLKQGSPAAINILILGIGGENHDGPNLTDTIILANINETKNRATLTSIPRDLWVPELNGANKKINEAYAHGESKRKGGGLIESKAIVGKITGQPVDYAVRIDFSGFVKSVDIIGGLDIDVENTLDDYEYPVSGKENDTCGYSDDDMQAFLATASAEKDLQEKFACRYKHLHFDKGLNHMDGLRALEFVRSRHAVGVESGDFARSKRQQKVITAFKDKILSAQTLVNPARIISLYDVIKDSIDTDIKQEEFDDFIRLSQKMKNVKIQSLSLDTGDEKSQRQGLLSEAPISSEYNFLFVLIPRLGNGNFSEIQRHIACQIEKGNCSISPIRN